MFAGVKSAVKPLVRAILHALLLIVRRTPFLKPPILLFVSWVPPLKQKIEHFVSVRPLDGQPDAHSPADLPATFQSISWSIEPDEKQMHNWKKLFESLRQEEQR